MRRLAILLGGVVCALSVGAAIGQGPQASPKGVSQRKLDAVNFVRLVNTAEIDAKQKNGRFVTLEELVTSSQLQHSPSVPSAKLDFNSPGHLLPGFSLQITTSSDGLRYQLSLVEDASQELWGLFSSDKGLIYEGRPID